jgi:hypothetical protein
MQAPTKQATRLVIQKLNNNKAPSIDGISVELLKLREVVVNKIYKLVGIIWERERIPKEYYVPNP